MENMVTEPVDIGQDVVILTEKDQELQLNQPAEEVELKAQRVVESFSFFSTPSSEEIPAETNATATTDTTELSLTTTPFLDLLQEVDGTSSPAEMSYDSQNLTTPTNGTVGTAETFGPPHNMSLLSAAFNETDSHHNFSVTFHQSEPESTTWFSESSNEPHTHNQTVPDSHAAENTQPTGDPTDSQEALETNSKFEKPQTNYSETDGNNTKNESFPEVTFMTLEPVVQVKLEEDAVDETVQMSPSTQAPNEEGEAVTQTVQTTKSSIKELTSVWSPLDGSGDVSHGMFTTNINMLNDSLDSLLTLPGPGKVQSKYSDAASCYFLFHFIDLCTKANKHI